MLSLSLSLSLYQAMEAIYILRQRRADPFKFELGYYGFPRDPTFTRYEYVVTPGVAMFTFGPLGEKMLADFCEQVYVFNSNTGKRRLLRTGMYRITLDRMKARLLHDFHLAPTFVKWVLFSGR